MTADDTKATEQAVLAILAGTSLAEAASRTGIDRADLADAVQLYRAAGHAALQTRVARREWLQVQLQFPDQDSAERAAAADLSPQLCQAEAVGLISSWWFIRKPQWRLRCQPGRTASTGQLRSFLGGTLEQLRTDGKVTDWCEGVYEPETCVFGGIHAMAVAHSLFHEDSRDILEYLALPDTRAGRRELSILLCNLLMRAARQDWYERGDIWARVAEHRPDDPSMGPEGLSRLKPQVHRLMTVDFGPESHPVRDGHLQFAARWVDAFEQAGTALADLADRGQLTRGLRTVIAHHILFHWNRLGIAPTSQAALARAARDVVFGT